MTAFAVSMPYCSYMAILSCVLTTNALDLTMGSVAMLHAHYTVRRWVRSHPDSCYTQVPPGEGGVCVVGCDDITEMVDVT
ncbi:unnamed protein product [Somion occarium]|uniref:Secreted protein n=1 Tax=Somion occarium TaxID=3059160 RepID=A0ABP1DAV8_9APHY